MTLALISDTHGLLPPVEAFEGADAIIHAGDIGPDGDVSQWIHERYIPWANALPCPLYATLGNHDFPQKWHVEIPHLIVDDFKVIGDHTVWFSPWSPTFGN